MLRDNGRGPSRAPSLVSLVVVWHASASENEKRY
jgi:hypothetical protein